MLLLTVSSSICEANADVDCNLVCIADLRRDFVGRGIDVEIVIWVVDR